MPVTCMPKKLACNANGMMHVIGQLEMVEIED